MQLHLEIEIIGNPEAAVDHRRHRAPVLVDLQPEAAAGNLVEQGTIRNGCPVHQTAQRQSLTPAKEPSSWVRVVEDDSEQGRRPRCWE